MEALKKKKLTGKTQIINFYLILHHLHPAESVLSSFLLTRKETVTELECSNTFVYTSLIITLLPWLEYFFTESESPWTKRCSTFSYSTGNGVRNF